MKNAATILMAIALLAIVYFAVDALITNDPNRRRRDLTDIRIIGTAASAIRAL